MLHFIDSSSDQCLTDKKEVEEELKLFDKKQNESYFTRLGRKKMFFILTKTDKLESPDQINKLVKTIKLKKNQRIFPLSNKTKKGLNEPFISC